MQNKGLIRLFAILFGLVSLYQLSFTYFAGNVEDAAKVYAKGKVTNDDGKALANFEKKYLDSVGNTKIINLGFAEYSYNDIRDKEMNLGLDLKGGINAVLQVSVKDILIGLSNETKNQVFNQALTAADDAQKNSTDTYLNLFFLEFEKLSNGTVKLSDPSIFGTKTLADKGINFSKTNAEVKPIIQGEIDNSINTAFEVLRSRIDKFGVTQPNIQRVGNSGRIQIELPGAKDIDRVKRLLESTAKLQFWEVFSNTEIQNFFFTANTKVTELLKEENPTANDSIKKDDIDNLLGKKDSTEVNNQKTLFTYLYPNVAQNQQQVSSLVAQAKVSDTATVNKLLNRKEVRALLPTNLRYVKFLWDYKAQPNVDKTAEVIGLYAIKSNRKDKATIEGDVIVDAAQVFDQLGNKPEVSMTMNSSGSKQWEKMTTENAGRFVAVVLDDYVYTAPSVNQPITGGRTSISGGLMTITEAQDIATVLKAGKLPAAARIIESSVVGPSLGQESIDADLLTLLGWLLDWF